MENEVEEKKSVENEQQHETIIQDEKIISNVKEDTSDTEKVNKEVGLEGSNKQESGNDVEESRKETNEKLRHRRKEGSGSIMMKQLTPSKVFNNVRVIYCVEINHLSIHFC
jgi:hypothetical protein